MNSFVMTSVLLACSALAMSASIGSPLRQDSELTQFRDPLERAGDAAEQARRARQLSLSGVLSNALGGGVGLVPGVGSLLSAPVSSLLQGPLSSTFGALTGGLVTRVGLDSEWLPWWPPQQGFGRSEAQAQPWVAAQAAEAAAPIPLHFRHLQPDQPILYLY